MLVKSTLLALLPALVAATAPPGYNGMKVLWQDTFAGSAGAPIDGGVWNVFDAKIENGNDEQETYTASNRNLQLSGGGTVQLVPWRDSSAIGGWTSARIESKAAFTPRAGKVTRVEASIRMGAASAKAGWWPAFWLLGDAIRHGTPWPRCGEIDIVEMRNAEGVAYGTAHCGGSALGGLCNEPAGRAGTLGVGFDDQFHTWGVEWDRKPGNWRDERITWYRDGQVFNSLTGAQLGDEGVWGTLAHSPFYVILNVAIGGFFPGMSDMLTEPGYGNMMEVMYVGVWEST